MRRASTVLFLAVLAGVGFGAWRASESDPATPEGVCLPAHLVGRDARPSLWLFVREGCPHCVSHLQAFRRCLASLSPAERDVRLAQVHVIGWSTGAPAGAHREPEALRTALAVRRVPTTWLVDGRGRIRETWRGARGSDAWDRALAHLGSEEARP